MSWRYGFDWYQNPWYRFSGLPVFNIGHISGRFKSLCSVTRLDESKLAHFLLIEIFRSKRIFGCSCKRGQCVKVLYEQVCKIWRRYATPFFRYPRKAWGADNRPPPGRARDKVSIDISRVGSAWVWALLCGYCINNSRINTHPVTNITLVKPEYCSEYGDYYVSDYWQLS